MKKAKIIYGMALLCVLLSACSSSGEKRVVTQQTVIAETTTVDSGETQTTTETETMDGQESDNSINLFEEFYYNTITDHEFTNVFMADVDHDDEDEMILVYRKEDYQNDTFMWIKVYKQIEGRVELIYVDESGGSHAARFFNITLHNIDGKYYLGRAVNDLWQGYGYLIYRIFSVKPEPNKSDYAKNEILFCEVIEGNGTEIEITDEQIGKYEEQVSQLSSKAIVLLDAQYEHVWAESKAKDIWNRPSDSWQLINNKWYYYNEYGAIATNCWVGDYYVGNDGVMLVSTTTPDGFNVGADGKWTPVISNE